MKKILILGAASCEIVNEVKELPKGNEEIKPLRTYERLGGSGAHMAAFLEGMHLPYILAAATGSGPYGEQVQTFLDEKKIKAAAQTEEPAGCMMRLIDPQGKQSFFLVPGAEYSFQEESVEDISNEDLSACVFTGDFLVDENSDDLLQWMSWLTCTLYFVPGIRLDEMAEETLESIYSLSPVIVSDGSAIVSLSREKDLLAGMKVLGRKTSNTVIALAGKDGAVALHEGETFRTDESGKLAEADDITMDEFASALIAALSSHVDMRNSLVFAKEAAERSVHLKHVLTPYEYQALRQRLAGMIIHG